jgi:outer membrane protein OmpA-like peptidoglycan-associated protein
MSKRRIGRRAYRGSCLAAAFAITAVIALGGCSSWFKSDSGEKVIEPEKAAAKPGPDTKAAAQKADSEGYPNLADVPKRPPVTPPDQRIIIEEGLLADRANARYTNQPPRWNSDTGTNSTYAPQGGASAAAGPAGAAAGPNAGAPAAGGAAASSQADSKMKPAPRTGVAEVPVETDQQASAASPAAAVAAAQIATLQFAEGSSTLPADSMTTLQQIASAYQARGGIVRIVGHTSTRQRDPDPEKDKLAKFDLSLSRANAVAAALAALGVDREKIITAGRGDTQPAAPAGDSSRAAENRRADVFMQK